MRLYYIVLAALLLVPGLTSAEPVAQVFVLHSYSQEYPWTQSQHNGFMQALADDPLGKVTVSTEYLDTKRRSYDETYANDLARHLRLKYSGYKPSAIYVTDDNALLFARDHLSGIFPGVPVFFSGINDYDVLGTLDPARFTGVFELKEVAPNLRWLLSVDKNANDLVFVGDGSNTYQAVEIEARKEMAPSGLRASFISETRLDRALERLRSLPGKYLFLTTVGGMTDADGQVLPLRDIIRSFAKTGHLVVSMEDGYVMEGVLGGWVTSGRNQGAGAARSLLAYLHGKPVSGIPPILKSPNAMIFDEGALQKNGISMPTSLRDHAVLLNPLATFYEKNHYVILGVLEGLAAVLFLVVTGALVVLSRRNRELRVARSIAEQAESIQREALDRIQKIASRVPGVVFQYRLRADGSSCFPFASEAIREIYRVTPGEVQEDAAKVFSIIHPDDSAGLTASIQQSALELSPWKYEYRVKFGDGCVRVLFGNAVPQREDDGSVLWHGFITDITAQKEAEKELLETNRHLEKAIARAKELTVQADAANLAKSAFLAAMSHEIRTPLNGILGSTEILSRSELKEDQNELIQMILTSGDHLLSTINDILDFSKIEAGQIELEEVDFPLIGEVEKVLDVVTPAARKRGVELAFIPEPGIPAVVRGDVTRLRQVLVNLVGNAIKFTERGSVTVHCEKFSPGRICFKVRDTGIGIPAEKLPLLFEPFTQADNSTTRRFGGTGLGLAISQRLVQIMGGELRVESKPGTGSCFSFDLPIPAGDSKTPSRGWETELEVDLSGFKALVIDDAEVNLRLVHHAFAAAGGTTILADSFDAGLKLLRLHPEIDLILLDRFLPDIRGEEAVHEIRRCREVCPPVILLASDIQSLDRGRFAAVLQKPLKVQTLVSICKSVLSSTSKPVRFSNPSPENQCPENPTRVLLADDNEVNRKIALLLLKALGVSDITLAFNGNEAVEQWKRGSFDIVFMDCQMPGMDGRQATRLIREHEKRIGENRHQIIIGLSAGAMSEDRQTALAAGMDDYLIKPIKRRDLGRSLDKWAKRTE